VADGAARAGAENEREPLGRCQSLEHHEQREADRVGEQRFVLGVYAVLGADNRLRNTGLNLSDVPKVFIETGNMNNPTDARHLEQPSFRQRAAKAIADGLARYLTQ
jgi:N-acetylmuramoyl-L-alanine amidase